MKLLHMDSNVISYKVSSLSINLREITFFNDKSIFVFDSLKFVSVTCNTILAISPPSTRNRVNGLINQKVGDVKGKQV